jgi:hypothetical protein
MATTTPYTYRIGWSKINRHYYGVRYANGCHPDDFWVSYFTSSEFVKEIRSIHGEPDIIQIRKVFDCPNKAYDWETKVLKRGRFSKNPKWINKSDNNGRFSHIGSTFTEEHRKKLSNAKRGKKISAEHKRKLHEGSRKANALRDYGEGTFKGKKHTAESIDKMKASRALLDEAQVKNNASKAGKRSAELYKIDPNKQKAHSERMKLWWAERKASQVEV